MADIMAPLERHLDLTLYRQQLRASKGRRLARRQSIPGLTVKDVDELIRVEGITESRSTSLMDITNEQSPRRDGALADIANVDDYLAQAEIRGLTSKTAVSNKGPSNIGPASPVIPAESIPIGGVHDALLLDRFNRLCQEHGEKAIFEFSERGMPWCGFYCSVRVGEHVVPEHGPFASKKTAKEAVAEKAVALLQTQPSPRSATAKSEPNDNWIGALQEFYVGNLTAGPQYREYQLGEQRFACECTIPHRPHKAFGDRAAWFPSKKAAKKQSAMLAWDWLRENGYLNESRPRKHSRGRSSFSANAPPTELTMPRGMTYEQRVDYLYMRLGLEAPDYKMTPSGAGGDGNDSALYSGAAWFPSAEPLLSGPIGTVRNVFGRREAQEECAKVVYDRLHHLAQKRGFVVKVA